MTHEHENDTPHITIIDENGNEQLGEVIHTFESEEFGKSYVLYSIVGAEEDENGEIEIRASAAKEPFKQQLGSYIEYKNILAAAKEILKHDFIAVKEINRTEKGIEEKKLDQEFNQVLKTKIQELEKQKKPERDLDFSR